MTEDAYTEYIMKTKGKISKLEKNDDPQVFSSAQVVHTISLNKI